MLETQTFRGLCTEMSKDITWRVTWFTRLARILPWKLQYKLAERLVNEANALRMASPKDGYEWIDRREHLFKGLTLEEQMNHINKAMTLEATRQEQEELNKL